MATISSRKSEEKWRVEADMRCLIESEQIKADPKRLAAARKLAQDQLLELAAVTAPAKT